MTNRLFITLDFPEDVLAKLIEIRKEIYDDPTLRWEPVEKLHLTLKFLGDVNINMIDEIKNSLDFISSECREVISNFTQFGIFYKFKKPSILWIGIEKTEELEFLHLTVNREINKLGFQSDKRSFKPHLTLLRLKGKESLSKIKELTNLKLSGLKFRSSKISLMKSELSQTGSIYKNLYSNNLIQQGG